MDDVQKQFGIRLEHAFARNRHLPFAELELAMRNVIMAFAWEFGVRTVGRATPGLLTYTVFPYPGFDDSTEIHFPLTWKTPSISSLNALVGSSIAGRDLNVLIAKSDPWRMRFPPSSVTIRKLDSPPKSPTSN